MSNQIVHLEGLPSTCNPTKIKVLFESLCKVSIQQIYIDHAKTTVKLAKQSDYRQFCSKLPKYIKFGNSQYQIAILKEKNERQNTSSDISYHSSVVTSPLDDKKRLECWRYSRIQSWSEIEHLEGIMSGILIHPTSTKITPDEIKRYFEDEQQSHGGKILDIVPMADGIFISFFDDKVADKVWLYRPHRIGGKSVRVFLKLVPQRHSKKYLIKSVQRKIDIDSVKLKLTEYSNGTPVDVDFTLQGDLTARFQHHIDDSFSAEIVQRFNGNNKECKMIPLLRSDCIIVSAIPEDVSDDEVKELFENKDRTGGGTVTRIAHQNSSSRIVYFSSYLDAERVYKTFRGTTVPLFQSNMVIKLGSCDLPLYTAHLSEISQYYKKWLPNEDNSKSLGETSSCSKTSFILEVETPILHFFEKDEDSVKSFEHISTKIHDIKVDKAGLKILCDKNHQQEVQRIVSDALKDYVYEEKEVTPCSNIEIHKRLMKDPKEVLLTWKNQERNALIISGHHDKVATVIKSLNEELKSKEYLNLDEDEIRWFIRTKELERLKKSHLSISTCTSKQMKFSGTPEDVRSARKVVDSIRKNLHSEVFTGESECVDFLKETIRNEVSLKCLEDHLHSQNMNATLTLRDDLPFVICPSTFMESTMIFLKNILVIDETVEIPSHASLSRKLESYLSDAEKNYWVRIIRKKNVISLVGLMDDVNSVKEGLYEYDVIISNRFCMSQSRAELIIDILGDAEKFKEEFRILLLKKISDGILIKGLKDAVENASKKIKELDDTVKILEFECSLHGAGDFVESQFGKEMLRTAKQRHNSTVMVTSENSANVKKPSTLCKGTSHFSFGRLDVTIKLGDIVQETTDAILTSVHQSCDMKKTRLSTAIFKSGGEKIQQDLQCSSPKNRSIYITKAGNLKCKEIFHIIFPADPKQFVETLMNSYMIADEKKFLSLSIPAVGTGDGNLETSDVAQNILDSFLGINKKWKPLKHLQNIYIILNDTQQLSEFQKCFSAGGDQKSAFIEQPRFQSRKMEQNSCMHIGPLKIYVRQGDITNDDNHAIVNSVGSKFCLSKGLVSRAILHKGGQDIQEELDAQDDQYIRVTSGGNLRCNRVIHAVTSPNLDEIGSCLQSILEKADEKCCPTLSIPAIGTGKLGLPVGEVASVMIKAVKAYASSAMSITCLRKVDFVVYDYLQFIKFRDTIFHEFENKVSFTIFSQDYDKATQAKEFITQSIQKALREPMKHSSIPSLTETMWEEISDRSHMLDTMVTRSGDEIIIEGVKKNRDELKKMIDSNIKKTKRSPVIWERCISHGKWKEFNEFDSRRLEEMHLRHKTERKGEYRVMFEGRSCTVDFESNTLNGKHIRVKKSGNNFSNQSETMV